MTPPRDQGERLTTYEQREQANGEWQITLAARGWQGYISIVLGVLYHASKLVSGVGVRLDGDTESDVLGMIDRIESSRTSDDGGAA